MYGKCRSACLHGIDGRMIDVEVDISNGLPQTTIVGLPDNAVRESVDRVRTAVKNSGFDYPMARITINLAPADLRKEGTAFDLAIACGILAASGQIQPQSLSDCLWVGELALDGTLRPVPGILSMVHSARTEGLRSAALPADNLAEAEYISGIAILALHHLSDLKDLGAQSRLNVPYPAESAGKTVSGSEKSAEIAASYEEDFSDVRGQYAAKRALTIAAAGMHNVLFVGPPGSGKTMLMKRLPTILPALTETEALEVTKIYSITGRLPVRQGLIRIRPFRSPHHTISQAGLVGGGSIPKPGEVSLAHRGVLFLDELPEFYRSALEVLRQPLEDRRVTLSRARMTATFPADFILAAAMNPCPCGYLGSAAAECRCTPYQIERYRSRISGPLLDRFDLHVEVPRLASDDLLTPEPPANDKKTSALIGEEVRHAHQRQWKRYSDEGFLFNRALQGNSIRNYAQINKPSAALLREALETMNFSARAYDRILKIARTIADLEGKEAIETDHVAEALQLRFLDRTAGA